MPLVEAIAKEVAVPLVLHGSSGVPDETLSLVVRRGMTKVNVATHLNVVFTRTVRTYLDQNPAAVDARRYVEPGRAAMAAEAERLLGVLGARGRAAEVSP
jgi:fructose-bisphosphate aldolase, class II